MKSRRDFSPSYLLETLKSFPTTPRYWIAYSGGCDSHVLLHALVSLRDSLTSTAIAAVHIDHGLSPDSVKWSRHCAAQCDQLGVPCEVIRVDAKPRTGQSPEAVAREARYRAFTQLLKEGEGLLMAHHRDDQAETVLLQLLRGAGPAGLAAMPVFSPYAKGFIGRPLLSVSRTAIRRYGEHAGLRWIDDPSNFDKAFDRNYLRHAVVPPLQTRWPAFSQTLSRVARYQAEALQLCDSLAVRDLRDVEATARGVLVVSELLGLDSARQRNVIRFWLRQLCLPLPSAKTLQCIQEEALNAEHDSVPLVEWRGAQIRRYRDHLFAMAPLPLLDTSRTLEWDMENALSLPADLGVLRARTVSGFGLRQEIGNIEPMTIRFRQGGERLQPAGRDHSHALKKLFQEAGVPPWQRSRVPLLYIGVRLAAVVGFWISERFAAKEGETGTVVVWEGGGTES